MPVIARSTVQKPRKRRWCSALGCGRAIEGSARRLYGYANVGDPKFVLWLHPECDDKWKETNDA